LKARSLKTTRNDTQSVRKETPPKNSRNSLLLGESVAHISRKLKFTNGSIWLAYRHTPYRI
jgi:hypothetical protein